MKQTPFPSLLNREWKYIPAAQTDISKTFERIRKEQREAQRKAQRDERR